MNFIYINLLLYGISGIGQRGVCGNADGGQSVGQLPRGDVLKPIPDEAYARRFLGAPELQLL